MNKLILILVIILFALQIRLWFGDGSLSEMVQLSRELDDQRERLRELEQRNLKLEAQVLDLQKDLNVYEERARHDLGMVKEGETFYQIIPSAKP